MQADANRWTDDAQTANLLRDFAAGIPGIYSIASGGRLVSAQPPSFAYNLNLTRSVQWEAVNPTPAALKAYNGGVPVPFYRPTAASLARFGVALPAGYGSTPTFADTPGHPGVILGVGAPAFIAADMAQDASGGLLPPGQSGSQSRPGIGLAVAALLGFLALRRR